MLKTSSTRPHHLASILLATLAICPLLSRAATGNTALLQGNGISITAEAVSESLQSIPASARDQILGDPEQLQKWVDKLYLRKTLAAAAERNGTAQEKPVQTQLQTLREGVLADAEVRRIELAALPAPTILETQARNKYRGESERFGTPAQTRASHILIKGDDEAAQARAEKLLAELKTGTVTFDETARKHSEDLNSAALNGDLGFFPKGRMVPTFDAALDKLKQPGELSGLVKTQFGYHIIRLTERKPAARQPYEEVRDQLYAEIIKKAQDAARTVEMKRVMDQAQGDKEALNAFAEQEKRNASPTSSQAAPAKAAGK